MTRITIRIIDSVPSIEVKFDRFEVKFDGKKIGTATQEQPGVYRIVLVDPPLEKRVRVREQFRGPELVDAVRDLLAARVPA